MKALVGKVNRQDLGARQQKELGVAACGILASTSRGYVTFFDGNILNHPVRSEDLSCQAS